jgi:hypothetical protein
VSACYCTGECKRTGVCPALGRRTFLTPKWCSYCQKSDHSDSECWCTRVAPSAPSPPIYAITPTDWSMVRQLLREEIERALKEKANGR